MSENSPNTNPSEEVDLGQLFKAISNVFDRFIRFIRYVFKSILSIIIFPLKALITNFKLVIVVIVVSAILGYALESVNPKIYKSEMFVKPYFDSKYQLVNNIDYFNALIESDNYEALSNLFDITNEEAEQIIGFEIMTGPESENDRITQYDNFLRSIDSIRAQEITFDDFIENRNIYSSDFFEISVESKKKDIFRKLEQGLNTSFKNTYSEKKMKKRDSLIYLQKQSILASLTSVDSLQKVYIGVLEEESKSSSGSISLGEGFSIEPEKSKTREFELLNKELQLRNELRILEEKKVEEDVFFDIVSGFQEVGNLSDDLTRKYSIIFPLLSIILLFMIFATRKTITFVKDYEY